jgi:hypothetical protein
MNAIQNLIYINTNSLSLELCNDIINLFEHSDKLYDGVTASGLNKYVKDTTDMILPNTGTIWNRINNTLANELKYNVKKYIKTCKQTLTNDTFNLIHANKLIVSEMQIQKYNKNTGKYIYHHDYTCHWEEKKMREITFLWYLNDVTEGGETEILGQYNVNPEAGKLLLFPSSWTFPHCGKVPVSNDKYILTGWLLSQH